MKYFLLYMNWDGFGKYYYDNMPNKEINLPNITALLQEGTFFENAHTGVPSITFPMQSSIVSGCYSSKTGNCDKYYNAEKNEITSLFRLNRAETIGEVLKKEKIDFVSIQQFALQDNSAKFGDKTALYIQPSGDYRKRFAPLIQLISTNKITCEEGVFQYEELPKAMFLYADDLDTIGHNIPPNAANTEAKRVLQVQKRLRKLDAALGIVIDELKKANIYDKTYILLTTDHGMISYKGASKIPQLKKALRAIGCGKIYSQNIGVLTTDTFDVLLTSHDIQCQVYFKNKLVDEEIVKSELEKLPFVHKVLTRKELEKMGVCKEYADMVVSPIEGCFFGTTGRTSPGLHATHDSLHEKCNHIFAYLKGPNVKANYVCENYVHNIDFLPALCNQLGLPVMKNATPTNLLEDVFF